MIRIKQIDFQNYRIAGTTSLSFDDQDNGYHMCGVIAENGTGKTTILNAITWCLYGEEYQLKDADRALPVINAKKLNDMQPDETAEVMVRLTIGDEKREFVFTRRQKILRSQTDDGVPVAVLAPKSEFSATESDLFTPEGTKSHPGEDAERFVADFFEKSIHDFFFFDGEKLENFFSARNASSIQTSVEAIAQISLLDTVIRNSKEISDAKSRKASKGHPNVKKLELERDRALSELEKDRKELDKLEREYEEKEKNKEEIDQLLKSNSRSAALQGQKTLLKNELDRIRDGQKDLRKRKTRLAVRGMTLIYLYPRIKSALQLIREKGAVGDYTVLLSKKQLQGILDEAMRHVIECPICGTGIETPQLMHLQKIISRQTIDDDTSLTLRTLEEDLRKAKEEILGFREAYAKIGEEERKLQDEYSKAERQFNDVSAEIIRLGTAKDENGNPIDFSKLEKESRDQASEIRILDRTIGAIESQKAAHKNKYDRMCAEYTEAVREMNTDKGLQAEIDTLNMVVRCLTSVRDSITQEVRMELEDITKQIFMRVVKKKETFGDIRISDSYQLSLYDEYGQQMTGSSSATEYMILAYSYTLAIHEASGHNCPLVIDSPLGRVSGAVRENTANMLLETSKHKQIIMLFTEDEYSESVRRLFEGKASMQTITLAEHEKTWEGASI